MCEYQLGKFLREQYGEFLGDTYTENKLYVRSTDVTRTKMSAQLVLAGLMPPNLEQMWNPELNWQPIPINYKSADEEDVCYYHKESNLNYSNKYFYRYSILPNVLSRMKY